MQPTKVSPLTMFSQPLQYLVPIFQRGYVWTIEKQIHLLWADIVDRAKEVERYQSLLRAAQETGSEHMVKTPRKHFLGTVIVTEHRAGLPGEPHTTEVIDGQQRMTTTQVLALAFRDVLSAVEDEFDRTCVDSYTWNSAKYREAHSHFKVWPTNAGRTEMSTLVEARSLEAVCQKFPIATLGSGKSKKRVPRPLLVEAYVYFCGVITYFLKGVDFDEVLPTDMTGPDAALNELLKDTGMFVEETWSTRWIHQLRHESAPVLDHADRPFIKERISLLLSTLTDYIQLIELRLGNEDDAQVIFESLNDRGERLTPADLVRNFVFLEATRVNASTEKLYEAHWRDFDEAQAEKGAVSKSKLFWKVEERQGRLTNTRLDTLLYHYVSMRTMDDIKLDHVFEGFKQWWSIGKKDVDVELARLKRAAALFRSLVLPDRSTQLGRFAHNMRVLDSTTMTPVVLFLGERIGTDTDEFLDCLAVLESYLVRRAVCGLTTKAYNRVFPGLLKRLSEAKSPSAALIADHLKALAGGETQNWPDDTEFKKAWTELNTYKLLRSAKTKMVLEALELGSRDAVHHESAQLPSIPLHVEHVMPVAWAEHWPSPGDDNAVLLRNSLLHNVGNLTLLTAKLNPSLSNSNFSVKRPEITKSLLALNAHFQAPAFAVPNAAWDEACIKARALSLFAVATNIWPYGVPKPLAT